MKKKSVPGKVLEGTALVAFGLSSALGRFSGLLAWSRGFMKRRLPRKCFALLVQMIYVLTAHTNVPGQ